jgi:hypothetical protein
MPMSKIEPNSIIKHEKFMDVCFQVLEASELYDTFNIKGWWVNMGFERSWIINKGEIFIKRKDLDKWYMCTDAAQNPCLRYCEWQKIN